MKEYHIGDIVTDGELFDRLEKISEGNNIVVAIPEWKRKHGWVEIAKYTGITLGAEYIDYSSWERHTIYNPDKPGIPGAYWKRVK